MSVSEDTNKALTSVRFFQLPVQNEVNSKKHGRPMYDDMEMCEVRFAGNREKIIHAPAHEVFKTIRDTNTGDVNEITYAIAYPELYRSFKLGETQQISGTPLAELPFLTASKRLELKALNIHTGEALAALDGSNLKMLGMGGRELKTQAQTYLDNASGSADVVRQAALIAAQDQRIAQLEARLAGGGAGTVSVDEAPAEPIAAPEDPNASPFFIMEADDIKNWIAEATGSKPKGNPSHATLVKLADEINAEIAKKNKAA
jgi:hypothetical protein